MNPRLFILAASLLWSTAGAAIKLSALSGWQLNAGRSLVAAVFLALVLPHARRWPTPKALLVSLAYAGTVLLFVLANKATTAANTIFLQSSAPLYVLLLSPWLLKERPGRGALVSVPICMLGLLLLFVEQIDPGRMLGNAMALASGVTFALTILGMRKLGQGSVAAVVWGNLIAAAVALPFAWDGPPVGWREVSTVLYLGVFQLGLAYALFARGVQGTPALEASLLVLIEPVLNPLWAYLLAGERPGVWSLAGGALLLAGTTWQTVAPLLGAARAGVAPGAQPQP